MPTKWPDSQVRREIHELNREFLGLVRVASGPGTAFGLPAAVRQRLAGLAPAQLDAVAGTPCLLAGFAAFPPRQVARGVEDGRPPAPTIPGPEHSPLPITAADWSAGSAVYADATRLFAAALLAWLWHTARRDPLLAALCIGPGNGGVEHLAASAFHDLQRAAANAPVSLEARFCRHPRLWPDLMRAASTSDIQVLTATRLSIVQLTLISRH